MSIIQKIRDKYAALAIAVIAIAMVGFILIDALSSRTGGGAFGSNTTDVGKVNGEIINRVDFDGLLKRAEDNYTSQGMQVNEELRGQINNSLWRQMVDQKILDQQMDDLGLTFTQKELDAVLYGANPPEMLRERFTDPKTGQYQADQVREMVRQLKRRPASDPQRQALEDYINNKVIKDALRNKYLIMLMGGAYYPKWLAEKDNQDNSAVANISYVDVPYALISDSSIKVTDAEIDDYVSAHKGEFKSDEASRDISYVLFSGDPSPKNSAVALSQVEGLRAGLADAKDPAVFLNENGSSITYNDQYQTKDALQVPDKDSIVALPIGGLFGPFLFNGSYAIAKMIDKKDLPDSVRARHILVGTIDPNTRQPTLDDSTAKRKIDSIQNLIDHGANWDSLAAKLSDDPGSKDKGGDMGYFTADRMVKEFSDFSFNGKKGERKIVKTVFGYHLIEILDQKNIEPHYKVAFMAKDIQPSDETTNAANVAATSFSADAQGGLSFEDAARKHHVSVRTASLHESEYDVQGIGPARSLIKWTFQSKKGTIGEPEEFGNEFIVAVVTGVHDAGLPSGTYARLLVENSVRREKKAKIISDKLGHVQDLSAAAAGYNQTVQHADSVHFTSMAVQNLGNEPKVVGAAFFKGNLSKVSEPIQGNSGVYFLKTDGLISLPNQNNDYTIQRQNMEGVMRQSIGQSSPEGMHEAANIKDYRIKFY
jgi:peptidyl-prolyl cis-trans isomerase D